MEKWVSYKSSMSDFIEWYSWSSFRLLTSEFSPCVLFENMPKVELAEVVLDMDQSVVHLGIVQYRKRHVDGSVGSHGCRQWVLLSGLGSQQHVVLQNSYILLHMSRVSFPVKIIRSETG